MRTSSLVHITLYKQIVEERDRLKIELEKMTDAAEMLWVVLANVSGSDWSKQTEEWQKAAACWRDNYFAAVPRKHGKLGG